jgi:hypothetical protein
MSMAVASVLKAETCGCTQAEVWRESGRSWVPVSGGAPEDD